MIATEDATRILASKGLDGHFNEKETSFFRTLDLVQIEMISSMILRCTKIENEKCAEVVRSHERYYTKNLSEIEKDILERYK